MLTTVLGLKIAKLTDEEMFDIIKRDMGIPVIVNDDTTDSTYIGIELDLHSKGITVEEICAKSRLVMYHIDKLKNTNIDICRYGKDIRIYTIGGKGFECA